LILFTEAILPRKGDKDTDSPLQKDLTFLSLLLGMQIPAILHFS
jgi:hypothetical protein